MDTACYCSMLRAATRRLGAAYDEALLPFGINIAQFALIRTIARNAPVSHTELGTRMELDRSTIGRNVRVLERMGLASTGRADGDQRETLITLTKRGQKLLKDAIPVWEDCQRAIEARMGTSKIEDLRGILQAI